MISWLIIADEPYENYCRKVMKAWEDAIRQHLAIVGTVRRFSSSDSSNDDKVGNVAGLIQSRFS